MINNGNDRVRCIDIADHGPDPFVADIFAAARNNELYRTTLWTGKHMQATLMKIAVCEQIGLGVCRDADAYIMAIEGVGLVTMGKAQDKLTKRRQIRTGCGVFIPAGTWYDVINTAKIPLRLLAVTAPPELERGTVHPNKATSEYENGAEAPK